MTAIIFIIFAVLLCIAVPVGLAVGITAILPSLLTDSFTVSGVFILRSMVGGLNQTTLLAIPLFVLSGIIMARGGISKKLFDVFAYFIGKKTAGIPCAVVITCLFFGAISGSAPATVAAVGSMTIPIMLEMGYDKRFTVALVAVAGGLGVIIPPSIPFILYAQASESSVSDLFKAGIVPGILIAIILMGYAWFYCKKNGEDKKAINRVVDELHKKSFGKVFAESIFALLTPVIILGCIYSGVTSPTEAACISVFYALIISLFVYRSLKITEIWGVCMESVRTFAPILFILAASVAFSRILTLMNVPQAISEWITGGFSNKVIVLLLINFILLIVGMILDTTPAILILTPILLPVAEAFGISAIQFGIIMVVNLAIGFVTPPIGVNLFVASSLTDVPVMDIAKKAMPMILLFMIALLLVTFIPAISLCLIG
ncbi:MAG: TRAP transporter large permease [Lachnospiraceae bacterium]|nr:TRAP transporter large permease [Lachnospiraceae bacterium]